MKRKGNLYDGVMTIETVRAAWRAYNARRPVALRHDYDEEHARQILNRMRTDYSGIIGKPRIKHIYESGKVRRLQIPSFDSAIAQLSLWHVCGSFVERRIHSQSFSSRRGMGGHLAARKVERFVHQHENDGARYCLYFDVRKYYQHIDRRIMMDRLERIFKDRKILELFRVVLESADEGLPIGYPFSHALANLYLTPLYFLVRSIRGVAKAYVYMDNWIVFSKYKSPLRRALAAAKRWLGGVGCQVKNDWQIYPTASRGVRVCGFVITHGSTRLYRRIWHRIVRNVDFYRRRPTLSLYRSLMSRLGWLKAINMQFNPALKIEGEYLWTK